MNMPPERLQQLIKRQATMTKAKERVTFLMFNEDAEFIREHTDTRTVYRFADGTLEINSLGRCAAYQCGERVIAFGGQRMPCRKSARVALQDIVKAGRW